MDDSSGPPAFTPDEFKAIRLLLAERGPEIRNPELLSAMRDRKLVREDGIEGWVVTYPGHRRYLKALLETFHDG
ncbi:hypothetical protein [Hansschlegelia plantiphila]|uniref:Uncharacterized protein n=1 Tax=Hansschlegelia plantiphila TaxID=374655 RepID=A0A9W6J0G0_9HYPH|nr:hypothetical protein [Hansschlegelia plantiphila]GLK66995.1 hypothetical protein GCM10008179_06330 [Hansschlegelia plantiphila]